MKVSIITVNFNNLHGLKKTVQSVLDQTKLDIEYIIIDGGSTDGSEAYIREKADKISYWVSESDNGIYHAMNKGIAQSSGDYLLFLNSGDELAGNQIVSELIDENVFEDIIYGDAEIIGHELSFIKQMPRKLSKINLLEFVITHQSMFIASRLFSKLGFYDESYKICADWVFYTRAILAGATYKHVSKVICKYDQSGISSKAENKEIIEIERKRFFIENAEITIPMLMNAYKSDALEYRRIKNSRLLSKLLSFGKLILKIKEKF